MIRTIFFDFGNVVGFFDHDRAIRELARFTDMSPTELGLQLYGGPLEDDYECGKLTTEEYVREALLNGRLRCTPELAGLVESYRATLEKYLVSRSRVRR